MIALLPNSLSDRFLGLVIIVLAVVTLAVAAEAHVLCSIFCIHGDAMTEICAGRA